MKIFQKIYWCFLEISKQSCIFAQNLPLLSLYLRIWQQKYSKFWRQIQIPKYSLANGSRPKDLMPKSSMHIWKDDGWLTYRKGYMHCKEPIQYCCMLSLPTISNFRRIRQLLIKSSFCLLRNNIFIMKPLTLSCILSTIVV